MKRAVFLDRDGVLNEPIVRDGKPYPPASIEELVVSGGAAEALVNLKALGFMLLVVSNQPDVSRGTQSEQAVLAINQALKRSLPIDAFYVCFHDDADSCDCRKPLPGLLVKAAADYSLSLQDSYLIGDRWRDVDAGFAAGCTTVLIDRGYKERAPEHPPDIVVNGIRQAAQAIAGREKK